MHRLYAFSEMHVRRLDAQDAEAVHLLYLTNPQYFDAMHDTPTLEGVKADLTALPPNKTAEDKYFLGFYEGESLVAIMDLILAFPDQKTALIGLFMVHSMKQGNGLGTRIITQTLHHLKTLGFSVCRLGYVDSNLQSKAFWEKNGFLPTGDVRKQERCTIVLMEKRL